MIRAGAFIAELALGVVVAGTIAGLAAQGVRERLALARSETRAADLETAQNLLDACRAGADPVLPPGWRCDRAAAAPGIEAVTVIGPRHLRLTTLRPVPR